MRLNISWPLIVATVERFTLSYLCGVIALLLIVYVNYYQLDAANSGIIQVLITLLVFTPLIVSVERAAVMKSDFKMRLIGTVVVVILAILYCAFVLPNNLDRVNEDRYVVQIGIHVMITRLSLLWIVPALMKRTVKETRSHALKLIGDTLLTGLFCGVLFAGLAAALGVVQQLFGILIEETRYPDLAAIIFLGFGGLFRLTRLNLLPPVYTHIDTTFPKFLRIFAEYILGFLIVIYAIILIAYTFKIVVSGIRPEGTVAPLIFGFIVMVMAYIIILLPSLVDSPQGKLRLKLFGAALVGCSVLLVLALQLRVVEYGWTVNRIFIVIIALWILLIAGTLLIGKPSLKWWIVSGSLIALLGLYGPINVFTISKDDQYERLTKELAAVGINQVGDKAANGIDETVIQNISSRVDYLLRYYEADLLTPFVSSEVLTSKPGQEYAGYGELPNNHTAWTLGNEIMESWGLEYNPDNM